MADAGILNKMVGKARKHQADMQAMERGAAMPGGLVDPTMAAPVAAAEPSTAKLTEMSGGVAPGQLDVGVEKMQAANAADPSVQEKLNRMAALRAKFYGEK